MTMPHPFRINAGTHCYFGLDTDRCCCSLYYKEVGLTLGGTKSSHCTPKLKQNRTSKTARPSPTVPFQRELLISNAAATLATSLHRVSSRTLAESKQADRGHGNRPSEADWWGRERWWSRGTGQTPPCNDTRNKNKYFIFQCACPPSMSAGGSRVARVVLVLLNVVPSLPRSSMNTTTTAVR